MLVRWRMTVSRTAVKEIRWQGHAGVFGAAVGEVAQGLVDGQVSGYHLVDAVGAV